MGTKVYDNYADLITFNRNSRGTALRPIGYGDELVTNGTFDTDVSGWTNYAASFTTINWDAGTIEITASGGVARVNQGPITTTVGKTYKISVTCTQKPNNFDSFVHIGTFPGGTNYKNNLTQGDPVSTITDYVFTATSTELYIQLGALNTATVNYDNVSVKEVLFDREGDPLTLFLHPEGVPRIEYDADRNLKGLLIEPEATNLAFNDNNFNGFASCTIASVSETNPLGTTTDVFTATFTGTGGFRLDQNVSFVNGTTYSMGHFMKFNGQAITLNANGATGSIISPSGTFSFDASGQPSSTGDVKYNTYANGWYYVYAVATALLDGATRINWVTSETTSIIIYKSQYETGPIATSYMPTTGSPFTRGKDEATMTNVSGLIGQKEGTLYVEVDARNASGISQDILYISNNNFTNRIYITLGTGGELRAEGNGILISGGGSAGILKIALRYADNNAILFANGSQAGTTDTTCTISSGKTDIDIGQSYAATNQANMHIRAVQIIPRRLSDEQLIELTS